jgi:hypothetical protein
VAGIGAGLTGRPWIIKTINFWRTFLALGVSALIVAAKFNENFGGTLLRWLPGLLIAILTAKVAVSVAVFVCGLRRNVITPRWIGWIVGVWLACGVFVAGYAGLVCKVIDKTDLWIWIALAGFLFLPLADLAIAPLALAWNRHR